MRKVLALFALQLLLAAASCQSQTGGWGATRTPNAAELELEAAAAAWRAAEIDDYTMRVRFRHPEWHTQVLDVRVEDGAPTILAQSCVPRRSCSVHGVDGVRLTVDNVFKEARAAAAAGQIEHLVFHEKYRFPRIVSVSSDGDSWEIANFKVRE